MELPKAGAIANVMRSVKKAKKTDRIHMIYAYEARHQQLTLEGKVLSLMLLAGDGSLLPTDGHWAKHKELLNT